MKNEILKRAFNWQIQNSSIMKTKLSIIILVLGLGFSGFAQKSKYENKSTPLIDPVTKCHVRYYYFPNLEAYFDTYKSIYYFKEDGQWVTAEEIPEGYRGYSFYNNINVFITDYDDDYPCQFIEVHKKKYPYISNERIKKMVLSKN